MNTGKLKPFARTARTILRNGVTHKLNYWGFASDGSVLEEPQPIAGGYLFREGIGDDPELPNRWRKLRSAVRIYGFDGVVEQAAYTWFNRLIALKILEENGYELPLLKFVDPSTPLPRLLQRARQGETNFLTARERQRLQPLLANYEQETTAFGLLLTSFCHQPNHLIYRVFGGIDNYTDLLLPDDMLRPEGFLYLLNTTDAITPEDYRQVELIGWLYQFYISEKKDEVFSKFKKNQKAEATDIPAATQIFTPNWIVKYLVQNTIGRTWMEHRPDSGLKEQMAYYVQPAEVALAAQEVGDTSNAYQNELFPSSLLEEKSSEQSGWQGEVIQLTCLDPAVGSGHMLVEAFDLLLKCYQEEYYLPGEAARSILQYNLFGLDLDLRAVQLARFALLMKAAQYDETILREDILPCIYAMPEPTSFSRGDLLLFLGQEGITYEKTLADALNLMQQSQNLGSLMNFELTGQARTFLIQRWSEWESKYNRTLEEEMLLTSIRPFLVALEILTGKFACICTNPPYMASDNMNNNLKLYVNQYYLRSRADLMTCFMEAAERVLIKEGFIGMINLPSWMFISSFEEFRGYLLKRFKIESLLHLGRGIFGSDFGSVAFVLRLSKPLQAVGVYRRLFEEHVQVRSVERIEELFLNKTYGSYYFLQRNFIKIPGEPLAYWLKDPSIQAFKEFPGLKNYVKLKAGLATGDNNIFQRYWHEVDFRNIGFSVDNANQTKDRTERWYPCHSGGNYRKWYFQNELVVDWEKNGERLKNFKDNKGKLRSRPQNTEYYFKEAISWNKITSGSFTVKHRSKGFIYDDTARSAFVNNKENTKPLIALLSSKVSSHFLKALNPTMSFTNEDIARIPTILPPNKDLLELIERKVDSNLLISKRDWDSKELSWNFSINPLVGYAKQTGKTLEQSYNYWERVVNQDFYQLHQNEEELNHIFISLFGLQDEVTPNVHLRDITILQEELDRNKLHSTLEALPIRKEIVMQQLISYAVGCFLGRYRHDKSGLHISHSNATAEELTANPLIDDDGILPVMGRRNTFVDDAVERVLHFIQLIWGDETFTQNINFLQAALGRDLETYLTRDFWNHHCRRYSKKPIYWLFSSPKGAFQVLVYMHRMNRFTAEKVRSKYLLRHIQHLQRKIDELSKQTLLSKQDARLLDQLRNDQLECEAYDLLLKDIADCQIEIDLDNGVTRNLELFKGVVAEVK